MNQKRKSTCDSKQTALNAVRYAGLMDEKDFRKHLADLAHGDHHTEEHDWDEKSTVKVTGSKTKRTPVAAVKSTARKKTRKK
jgi:hypothetical protein